MMNFINMNHIYIHLSIHIINILSKLQSYLHISVTCIKKLQHAHFQIVFMDIKINNLVLHYV
jgi:hypothetical protein